MSAIWNKTLFYLGLVDEDTEGTATVDSAIGQVRPVQGDSVAPLQGSEGDIGQQSTVPKPGSVVAGRRIEPPAATRQRMSPDRTYAEAGVYIHPDAGVARADVASRRVEPESHIIVARNFSDAQTLADAVQGGRSVVLDLRKTEPEMVRRIVDFTSGLIYALDGKMVKSAKGVILVTPVGVTVGELEHQRLAKLGLFEDQT